MSVDDASDYVVIKAGAGDSYLSVLKLHKLLYYVQAWNLALHGKRLFDGAFEAWVHGPVNRQIYARYRNSKGMYSPVTMEDVRPSFRHMSIPKDARRHIGSVLDVYGKYTDSQLEEMTHMERPWQLARVGYAPNARCQVPISDEVMRTYYAARLNPGTDA